MSNPALKVTLAAALMFLLLWLGACQGKSKPVHPASLNRQASASSSSGNVVNPGSPPVVVCQATPDSVFKLVGNQIVTIDVQASGPENRTLTYRWSATGGAIVKAKDTQATVDTTNLAPGYYQVSATVSGLLRDGDVVCTSTITVAEKIMDCPHVSVSVDPRVVEWGTNPKVKLHVTKPDLPDDRFTCEWKADHGKISGSGDTVSLDLAGADPAQVNVMVTCRSKMCVESDSATVTIARIEEVPHSVILSRCNTYKSMNDTRPDNECKAFLDDAIARLRESPRPTLLLRAFSEQKESPGTDIRRAERMRDYLVKNGIDPARIVIKGLGTNESQIADKVSNKVVEIWLIFDKSEMP